MATFKAGDKVVCTNNDRDRWFSVGKTYEVVRHGDGVGVKDDGPDYVFTWKLPSDIYDFELATPEAPPSAPPEEDKALAWLKEQLLSDDHTADPSGFYRGYRAALEEMLEHGFGLSVVTEQVTTFVPMT